MTISETNLKLLKSERMTDYSDGGGKMTANEVVDGQVNNLFNDISQLDRTYGRVSLRKAFPIVETANTDTYLGAHIILTDPPDDANVHVTLFSTESWTDERDAARNRIESYSVAGPESNWILYGNHVVGQKMLMLWGRTNTTNLSTPSIDPTPEIGDVMLLSIEKTGYTAAEQYVRITKIVSRETQQFTDGSGNFFKDVLTLEISNPLRYAFNGATPNRYTLTRNHADSSPTVFRLTSVADAAEYYGVKKVTQSLNINDLTIQVATPYASLVPSAQAETPLVDVPAGMTRPNYIQAGASASLSASATLSGTTAPDYAGRLYLGRGVLPGSLALTIGGVAYKDDSQGGLVLSNGTAGSYGGSVDYASGAIVMTKASSWSSVAVSATATPAVAVYDNAGTLAIPVTINNRAFNWVQTLQPLPTPGSLVVDFKALDKWYRLYDNGLGQLNGVIDGIGTGTVNYATGSVLVTLAALPDVDSAILFAWTTPAEYAAQTYVAEQPKVAIKTTLANVPVQPGSLTISWTDGSAKTATANAAGDISGHATGRIVAANGQLEFYPTNIPASGTVFTLAYNQLTTVQDVFSVTGDGAGVVTFTLTQNPIKPGSVRLSYQVTQPGEASNFGGLIATPASQTVTLADDGAGNIGGGTINYSTGAVTFDATSSQSIRNVLGTQAMWAWGTTDFYNGGGWGGGSGPTSRTATNTLSASTVLAPNTTLTAQYALDSASPSAKSENLSLTELKINLATVTSDDLIAGSLKFSFAGSTFIDRQGSLYRAHSVTTDSATLSGDIDYQSGLATLTGWASGSGTLSIAGAVTVKGNTYIVGTVGRAPGSPLATGQFQLNCVAADGTAINVSANNNGELTHEWVNGKVDWETGIYIIGFGKKVLDSSLSAGIKANSGWYNAANVDGNGTIWQPLLVQANSITFNAVLISYIPLDADILGVETVRLPQDGRVPIYRVGNVGVVHNTQNTAVTNPATAGLVVDCGRTLLSYAKVFDANGLVVPTAKYTADLDAGTVTFANPLDLTGYVQPLTIEHRIEDMALITDVQITGQIKLMKPVRHAYPANTTFLSSALVIGDLQARVTGLFDQQTWASVFSDTVSGSNATASFNDVLYPIAVTNAGAIQERWAIVFTGSTAFSCYGEYSGLIAQGTTGTDFAPLNPITNTPYFSLDHLGWGSGWAAGNVLRFNSIAANYPLWLARTTLQSDPAVYTDNFKLQIRGDAN